jgi:6,7-dimethyl-8-ribityllumazine synthase
MDITINHQMPHGFGILTCENHQQAWERANVKDRDVGGRAALACLRMLDVHKKIDNGSI